MSGLSNYRPGGGQPIRKNQIMIVKNWPGFGPAEQLAQAIEAIHQHNLPPVLFTRRDGMGIYRLERTELGGTFPKPLSRDELRLYMNQISDWATCKMIEVTDRHGMTVNRPSNLTYCDVPDNVLKSILAMSPDFLPMLRGVVQCPVYVGGGRLVQRPGYDPESGIYYDQPADLANIPPVPERPTRETVNNAVWLLREEVMGDFRFVGPADKAAYIGLLLATVCRRMIDGPVPLTLLAAVKPGSGKSFLAEIVSAPTTGRPTPMCREAPNKDSLTKFLTSLLVDGSPVGCFDNLNDELAGGTLASFLTSRVSKDRLLGTNKMVTAAVDIVMFATANSPVIGFDMRRRIVPTTIDPGVENPHQRSGPEPGKKWRHPMPMWAFENRGMLLSALLTLVANWVAEGMPADPDLPELGSFESWRHVIGGIMKSAGIDGFLTNLDDEASGTETARWHALVAAWLRTFNDPVTARAIYRMIHGDQSLPVLFANLLGPSRDDDLKIANLDGALKAQIGVIWSGYRIEAENVGFLNQYWLVPAPEPTPTPNPSTPDAPTAEPTDAPTAELPKEAEAARRGARKLYTGILAKLGGDKEEVRRFGQRLDADGPALERPAVGPGEDTAEQFREGLLGEGLRLFDDPYLAIGYSQYFGVFIAELAERETE